MKSAQQRFNEALEDMHRTSDAIRLFVNASNDNYRNYGYAAGVLSTMLADAIALLPKQQREQFRSELAKLTEKQVNEFTAKEAA